MVLSPARVTPKRVLMVGAGYQSAKVVLNAVELGVVNALAARPATADEPAAGPGLYEHAAPYVLDAFVALGLLRRNGEGYPNSLEAALFRQTTTPPGARA
jgi:hypothetical protein